MNPSGGLGGGDALHAVDAGFVFEFRVRAFAFDLKDDFFKSAHARIVLVKDLRLPIMILGVAGVHAEEIGSEDAGLVAARPRPDFHDDAFLVARIFGDEQELEPRFQFGLLFLQRGNLFGGEFGHARIVEQRARAL